MTSEDMRAVVVSSTGATPTVSRMPRPELGTANPPGFPIEGPHALPGAPGHRALSLVEVTYASLNPIDLHVASGTFFQGEPEVPYIPGVEGVGRVVESGAHPVGTRVRFELGHAGYGGNGTMSEVAAVHDAGLVPLPDTVSDADAVAIGVAGITAGLVLDRADVVEGDTILVLGATGAIGKLAVQLARQRGAGRVIAAGRHPAQLERTLELGADCAVSLVDKSAAELTAEFKEAGRGGVDVVIDPLWGEVAMAALAAGNFGMRLVNFGQAAGEPSTPMPGVLLRNNRATVRGTSTAMDGFEVRRDHYHEVLRGLTDGTLSVDFEIYPLEDIEAAWRDQQSSPGFKIVLDAQTAGGERT